MKYCTRCLLPDTRPAIYIGADGICSGCVGHDVKEHQIAPDRQRVGRLAGEHDGVWNAHRPLVFHESHFRPVTSEVIERAGPFQLADLGGVVYPCEPAKHDVADIADVNPRPQHRDAVRRCERLGGEI